MGEDSEFIVPLVIFILGFFCCPIWCAGLFFMGSKNKLARTLSNLSLVFAFLVVAFYCYCCCLAVLIAIISAIINIVTKTTIIK